MAIRKPKPWGQIQPPVGYGIDWSDPINKALKGCWLTNEGAGNKLSDLTGFKNTGTVGTALTWGKGNPGKVLSYPGTNADTNAVTIASSSTTNIVGRVTMACWVYSTISNAYQSLIERSTGAASRQYAMFLSQNGVTNIFLAFGGSNIGDVVVTPNWAVNKWNFIAATADGTNARVYVNGVLANTTASALLPTSTSDNLSLGREVANGFSLVGLMGLSKIWARDLKAGEISRLYAEPYAGILAPERRLWNGAAAGGGGASVLSRYYYDQFIGRAA